MNRKEKRQNIGKYLDIAKNRFKEYELDTLNEYVNNPDMVGKSKTLRNSFTSWCSDGKYTRSEKITYTVKPDKSIQADYSYHDDDGQTGSSSSVITEARKILELLHIFDK